MKRCRKCNQEQPLDQFPAAPKNRDGLSWRCQSCAKAYRQQYHLANREHRINKAKEWNAANPERARKTAAVRNAQPEAQQARREYRRQRYASKASQEAAYQREWQRSHDGAKQIASLRYKLRKLGRGDEPVFTLEEWTALCERHDHCCVACRQSVRLTVDHIVPLSRQGASTIDNIQPLCLSCNSRKRTQIIDYRAQRDEAA